MSDLISKRTAEYAVGDMKSLEAYNKDGKLMNGVVRKSDVIGVIDELPSVQTETHDKRTKNARVCLDQDSPRLVQDCISRQDAIDALGEEPLVWSGKDEYEQGLNNQWHYDVNAIKAVPSAQPRKGKWIYKGMGGYHCSECEEQAPFWCMASTQNLSHYCPNCGARMSEGEEDE